MYNKYRRWYLNMEVDKDDKEDKEDKQRQGETSSILTVVT